MSGRGSPASLSPLAWRPLPGVSVPGIPGLLVSTDFTSTGQSYTVQLTDLANLWVESLDKRPIIMRALKEDTSIDPTDGPDQIRKLLDLLRAAFDPSAPEHGDTSLSLISGTGDDDDTLEIHVSVSLPKPLRPLKWPMYLKKKPQSAIATELVLPLVQAHQNRTREIDELVSTLSEKDGIITKLIDKLEATGTGLEHVFNPLSGRRKVTRGLAEEKIKGLAPFRLAEFRKQADDAAAEASSDDVVALLDNVFGEASGLPSGSALEIGESPALDDWWTKLGRSKSAGLVSRPREKKAPSPVENDAPTASDPDTPAKSKTQDKKRRRVADDNESTADEDDDDDEFQVQATPSKNDKALHNTRSSQVAPGADDDDDDFEVQASPPKHNRPALHKRDKHVLPDDDDETASETEDDAIPDSMPTETTKKPPSKLGTIGGKKKSDARPKTPAPSPPRTRRRHHSPTPPPPAQDDDAGSQTGTDPDDMDTLPPPPPPKQTIKSPSSQPARRLGRIGGGAKPAPKAATPEPEPAPSQSQTTPRKTRLGHIGKKVEDSPDGGDRGRSSVKEDEESGEEKRETSMERADRKRAELKAELERKAHQPVKKKRKF